ncbi:MAG: kinase/pyrophosphorylase [Rhodothermales bacterium]|nr:kinase/pyrophosphorylase [Rhodothermales bacterium]
MFQILVVSDGTGGTADRAVQAALTQFGADRAQIRLHANVRTREEIRNIIDEASPGDGFVVYTIVSSELRTTIGEYSRVHGVVALDLLGPLLTELAHRFADSPSERPGLFRELNREYFQRIEAMEFAFRHDDGQRTQELDLAEIIFVGVSRTFKTPLSIYLAFKGWLVANVPIVLDIPAPAVLSDIEPGKVVALTTDSSHLAYLRRARQDLFGGATGRYAEASHVHRELKYAQDLFDRHPGWSVVSVTNKPIEEIATEVLDVMKRSAAR